MRGRIKKPIRSAPFVGRLPEIGKIKIGMKNDKGYPVSLDYFRADSKYNTYFREAYGETPRSLTVVFTSDDLSQVCNQRYELRDKAGALFAHGDGETFQVYSAKDDEYVTLNINDYPDLLEQAEKRSGSVTGWNVVLTLRFILPEITGVAGTWSLTTKGEASSIPKIIGAFDLVQEQAGTVLGIPFDLQVEKVKSQKPNSRSKFPIISLVPNIGESNIRKVRAYVEQGVNIKQYGMLTDETINRIEVKQLNDGNS